MKTKTFFAKALFLPALLVLSVGCPKTTVVSPDVTESKGDTTVFQEHLEIGFYVDVYIFPESLWDEPKLLGRTSLANMEKYSIPENSKWFVRPADKNITDEDLLLFFRQAADSEIRGLSFRKCRWFTNAGLAHLKNLTALESLDLRFTQITDAGLAHLKNLTALESLNLSVTKITEAGLPHLKNLIALERLNLSVTKITDAGLAHLKNLIALERLNLSVTKITDAGLAHLKNLTSLKSLELQKTKITDTGVKDFRTVRPDVHVFGP